MSIQKIKTKKGIALVSVLSALTVVALLSIYVVTSLKWEAQKSAYLLYSLRAELLARAGLNLAISQLKYGNDCTMDNFCDSRNEAWAFTGALNTDLSSIADNTTSFSGLSERTIALGGNLVGKIKMKVLDSASQINLNDDNPNLQTILSRLPSMDMVLAGKIIAYKSTLPNQKFTAEGELRRVDGMETLVDDIKDYVTVRSWGDPKASTDYDANTYRSTYGTRSPVNVNTAPKPVLSAVLQSVVSVADANAVADALIAAGPFYSWQGFDTFIDTLSIAGLAAGEKRDIKLHANPNRFKPDPNNFSTEFCFHSGGYYDIEVLGTVETLGGMVLASHSIASEVKIFDLMQDTTKEDFIDDNTDSVNYLKATWFDACPIDEADDQKWQGYSGSDPEGISEFPYKTIANAVKLGFWDDFDEGSEGRGAGNELSRLWWNNDEGTGLTIGDASSEANFYTYSGGDWSDYHNVDLWESGNPAQNQLHAYDDVSIGSPIYANTGLDNELWTDGSGNLEHPTVQDFSKYQLGTLASGQAYASWDSQNGFYLRVFNYDGPRSSLGTPQNFPGFRWQNLADPTNVQDAGRNYEDNGRVEIFQPGLCLQLYLFMIGNVYDQFNQAIQWGDFWAQYGPSFHVVAGLWSNSLSDFHEYQRDKVYTAYVSGSTVYYQVDGRNIPTGTRSKNLGLSTLSGWVQLYSNANQSVWDDVRIIDDEGRISKSFTTPYDVDFGSFYCTVTFTDENTQHAYFVGSQSGGVVTSGTGSDISLDTAFSDFSTTDTTSSYYPDIDYGVLGDGAQAIGINKRTYCYSIRLTTTITNAVPKVPALEEITVTCLPATEIMYCYEE